LYSKQVSDQNLLQIQNMSTISEEQRQLNQELHAERPDFGSRGGVGNASMIQIVGRYNEIGVINSVLDYGTGKGAFPKSLKEKQPKLTVGAYDPAVEKFSKKPKSTFDLVTSFDVLEHVERSSVQAVLEEISSLTNKVVYLQIDLQPAVKRLSSGRNAHIMLAPPDWWLSQIGSVFPVLGSYPIMHASGTVQKIAVVAAKDRRFSKLVWSLLMKTESSPIVVNGGYLGKPNKKK
jgi:hypothetical protein|tara:strand:- start:4140 stop:4841 length:702 start_codon:yes stop_codon:yes gene_type:complete